MRDIATNKKLKRSRSSSCSSPFTISDDDDSPKPKSMKVRRSHEERDSYKKHHKHIRKHDRHRSDESPSSDEVKPKFKFLVKEKKYKEHMVPVNRIKEEPVSEDERERIYRSRHKEQSRAADDDYSRRHHSRHHREHSESVGTNSRRRRLVKEEIRNDTEPEWGKKEIKKEKKDEPAKNNAKPDFGLSGKLTEDANTFNGVVIKYSEPPEARKPKRRWRLYPFKGETSLPVLHIHRQSAYLMGRDRKVADIPIDHPSCSKQHAALQYRLVPFTRNNGSSGRQIKLYVIDLESANGTYLNNQKIEPKKYYELKERDVVKFGFSSREYVILHEHSKDSENDDDVKNDD